MEISQLQQVRRFNRAVARQIGALEDSYLRRGRPLGQARLLFEIGLEGADLRALRAKLKIDSGYVSRLLRALEGQALVRVDNQPGDGRVRRVTLTSTGEAERATYDRLSDDLALSLLTPLSTAQRSRLIAAMAEVERLLRAASVEVRAEAPDSAAARWCLQEYFQELAGRFDAGFDPAEGGFCDEEMTPPAGYFVVAWLDGNPAGCGGLRLGKEGAGEVKRIWTAPSARGLGIARRILGSLETRAREAGLTQLQLDTNRALHEAQAFYRQEGYREVARFNDNPYAHHWFEKRLRDAADDPVAPQVTERRAPDGCAD